MYTIRGHALVINAYILYIYIYIYYIYLRLSLSEDYIIIRGVAGTTKVGGGGGGGGKQLRPIQFQRDHA